VVKLGKELENVNVKKKLRNVDDVLKMKIVWINYGKVDGEKV
jgi:hypothetical protein